MIDSFNIVILYGSQTGVSQDIAEQIWKECCFYHLNASVMPMDNYPVHQLIFERFVIFVVSTTGQGEEPDNMKSFWKFLLRKSLPSSSLNNMQFAVLGLGDSSYIKFNFVAKRLTRRLSALGGTPFIDTGYADDQHDFGADSVVDKWITELWTKLGDFLNFSVFAGPVKIKFEPRWRVSVIDKRESNASSQPANNQYNKESTQMSPSKFIVSENLRTTSSDHFQDVRLIKLKTQSDNKYNPGDVLMLVPQNSDENVSALFRIINQGRPISDKINPNCYLQVTQKEKGLPVPRELVQEISLSHCAKVYWDLNAVPRRQVFDILANMTSSELEEEKLKELSASTGLEDLYNYCNRPKRTILEVLGDFPNAARGLAVDTLFDVLQPIKPRAFSIASSFHSTPDEVHVLLAVVNYKTKLLKPREGLCSTFLSRLDVGDKMYGWIRSGSFKFPQPGKSVIMVGPGTGVAPFRSYIQELVACNQARSSNLLLFFGCRSKRADFYFQTEWNDLVAQNQLKLVPCFSRDQDYKIYVQHGIAENGADVWNRLSDGATVLIAGSAKNMPASVREAFINVAKTYGHLSAEDAEAYVVNLERTGRYQTETWS